MSSRGRLLVLVLIAAKRGIQELAISFPAGEAALFGGKFERFFAVEFGLADQFVHALGKSLRGVSLSGGLAGERRANQERNFPADRFFVQGGGKFGEGAA